MSDIIIKNRKPIDNITAILNKFNQTYFLRKADSGALFPLSSKGHKMCFMLQQGTCELKRITDGMVIGAFSGPYFLGLNAMTSEPTGLEIVSCSTIHYLYIPLEQTLKDIRKHNLWEDLCFVQMYFTARFTEYHQTMNGVSAYTMICNQLRLLDAESIEVKSKVAIHHYVYERTLLSRSHIHNIIASLKVGGYIEANRGKLIKIHLLPERF